MRDRNNDNKRAAELLDFLMDDATDFKTKEKIRAWLWSDVSSSSKDIALAQLFRHMAPNPAPDRYDHEKYAELARRPDMRGMARIPRRKSGSVPPIHVAMRVAAVVVLLLGISSIAYLWVNGSLRIAPEPLFAEITVRAGESAQSITLPDGSSVELQAHSELTYDKNFTSGRFVHLDGEALFTIEQSVNAVGEPVPFALTSEDLRVDVYGTVFRVVDTPGDYGDRNVVSLYDGSVGVTANDVTTMLEYGQEYSYDNATKESSVTLIPATQMAGHGFKPLLRFDQASLADIVASLTANYGVEFVLPEGTDLSRGKFSGDFSGESLENVLAILTKSNVRFDFVSADGKVYIKEK